MKVLCHARLPPRPRWGQVTMVQYRPTGTGRPAGEDFLRSAGFECALKGGSVPRGSNQVPEYAGIRQWQCRSWPFAERQ